MALFHARLKAGGYTSLFKAFFCLALGVVLTGSLAARAQTSSNRPEEASAPGGVQQSICLLLESAARSNDLPVGFLVRLIWRESRFRSDAIGPPTRRGKRALGIAQFMPETAAEQNLLDPMNPVQALPKAGELLKRLRAEFGNLGLAAAAYNAGSARVRNWLAGMSPIPSETRSYVDAVTGVSIDQWVSGSHPEPKYEKEVDCNKLVATLGAAPSRFVTALEQRVVGGSVQPWGAILGSDNSRSQIMDRYTALQRRFAAVLEGRDPILLERKRGPLPRYQVRVGAETRASANNLCARIHKLGGDCVVLHNPRS